MKFELNNRILADQKLTMEDLKALSQVAEFHQTFKHPILAAATIPAKERCQLRIDLIAEELKELQEAVATKMTNNKDSSDGKAVALGKGCQLVGEKNR